MSWPDLLAYLRTFSALHTFHERYPQDLERKEGDIAVRFWNSLKAEVAKDQEREGKEKGEKEGEEGEIEVEWPLALILARRV